MATICCSAQFSDRRHWLQISEAQKDVGSNHAVSGLKFKILRHFLQLGYAVLLSDVDIVTLQNPFGHLHRDSDVEAMSDGWNNNTAYGKDLVMLLQLCHILFTPCQWPQKCSMLAHCYLQWPFGLAM